jgi:hypothetical protein
MVIVLCVALGFVALSTGYRCVRQHRGHSRGASDLLRRVFGRREYRDLDRHLERIAVDERRRLEASTRHYVAGDVGYVLAISGSRHGVGLGLSDGHRLELGGISRYTLRLLEQGAAEERLRPAQVTRDGPTYRLLLRGEAGAEIRVFAQRVTLVRSGGISS